MADERLTVKGLGECFPLHAFLLVDYAGTLSTFWEAISICQIVLNVSAETSVGKRILSASSDSCMPRMSSGTSLKKSLDEAAEYVLRRIAIYNLLNSC